MKILLLFVMLMLAVPFCNAQGEVVKTADGRIFFINTVNVQPFPTCKIATRWSATDRVEAKWRHVKDPWREEFWPDVPRCEEVLR